MRMPEPPHTSPLLLALFAAHLGCPVDQIDSGADANEFFGEDPEDEVWEHPPECEVVLVLEEAIAPGFTWGRVVLGTYLGTPFVTEQNASPLILHKRRPT